MDADRFDALLRSLSAAPSRRTALRLVLGSALGGGLGWLGAAEGEAGKRRGKKRKKGEDKGGGGGNKKKKRKKKNTNQSQEPPEACGGDTVCTGGQFCCDDEREVCCNPGDSCCNVGPGTGSCCPSPNRCGRPWGGDAAPFACCPPERQWFTNTGLVRCCPEGTRSLGTGVTSDDGPCCPEEKYCGPHTCCPDLAPVCLDPASGQCCTEENRCGDDCCWEPFGDCCGGECRYSETGPWHDCGDLCCWAGTTCCGNGLCCNEGDVCAIPCGNLPQACCTAEAFANGACCNTDCGDNCGG